MVSQFVPAPTPWALVVTQESDVPALRKTPDSYPVIGWEYYPDGEPAVVVWISYKGLPTTLANVLDSIRADVLEQSAQLGYPKARGHLSYTLVPA